MPSNILEIKWGVVFLLQVVFVNHLSVPHVISSQNSALYASPPEKLFVNKTKLGVE